MAKGEIKLKLEGSFAFLAQQQTIKILIEQRNKEIRRGYAVDNPEGFIQECDHKINVALKELYERHQGKCRETNGPK